MNLSIGIVGLPNVGKSTLFNALLKKTIANTANYPFCTIEPNVGVVPVPDERLPVLAKIVETTKIVPAIVEFYDIAGLVKGASSGEGLGNKFLSHIREVAAIAHVVRLFEDKDIIHVNSDVNPLQDIQTIDTELILADLATLQKQNSLVVKDSSGKKEQKSAELISAVAKLKEHLNAGNPANTCQLSDDEKIAARELFLLTMKPVIFVFNVSENQLLDQKKLQSDIDNIMSKIGKSGQAKTSTIYLNAKLENDVLELSDTDQKDYLDQYSIQDTGLNSLIKAAYTTLGLISFLTAGKLEARAWTIKLGETALNASAVIHTDFAKKFICADIVTYQDFVKCNGWVKAREQGKVKNAGRDYIMQDNEVVEFKIGA